MSSKIINRICTIRDLIVDGDYGNLYKHQMFIEETIQICMRYVKKYIDTRDRLPDFSHLDLLETAEDARIVLNKLAQEINGNKIIKQLIKNEVNNEVIVKFSAEMGEKFRVRAILTELHSFFTYLGVYLKFLEDQNRQETDIGYILTATLKSFL